MEVKIGLILCCGILLCTGAATFAEEQEENPDLKPEPPVEGSSSENKDEGEDCVGGKPCTNGGTCSDDKTKCNCLEGTSGTLCETIDYCKAEGETCTNTGGECKYDTDAKEGYCDCQSQKRMYDESSHECKALCQKNEDCKNGGTCGEKDGDTDFCKCLEGTKGDLCDVITWCETNGKNCEKELGNKCEYDSLTKTGFCNCKRENTVYNVAAKKCMAQCENDDDCKNGGTCEGNDNTKFCKCRKGIEGDKCEVILWCKVNGADCEKEAGNKCEYDPQGKMGFCNCKRDDTVYNIAVKKCSELCKGDGDCQNGGTCEGENDKTKFCKCPKGIEGDKCEDITWCKVNAADCEMEQGNKCKYDPQAQTGFCSCAREGTEYNVALKRCSEPCENNEDCENGGTCEGKDGDTKFCKCLEGTKGDLCDVIPWCEANRKDCEKESGNKCEYNPLTKMGFCNCTRENTEYNTVEKKCLAPCQNDGDCKNEGTCAGNDGETKFCTCLEGTKGDLCDIITWCEANGEDCEKEPGNKCEYNPLTKTGFCNCKRENTVYNVAVKKCMAPCGKDEDCLNKGTCDGKDNTKFCKCRKGIEGDKCEDITWCKVNGADCEKETGNKCEYDPQGKTGFCDCAREDTVYNIAVKKCSAQCQKNEDCKNGATCSARTEFCKCQPGTEGELCEIITWCEANREDCEKEEGNKCEYNPLTKTGFCRCKDGKALYDVDQKKCLDPCTTNPCENGGTCGIENFEVKCNCLKPYSGPKCSISPCTSSPCENGGTCTVTADGFSCKCTKRYEGDTCDKDKCKDVCKNGGKCSWDEAGDKAKCDCPNRYTGEKCEIDKCTDKCKNGGTCSWDEANNKVKCECPKRYTGEICDIDRCTDKCKNGGTCSWNDETDTPKCDCKGDYKGEFCEIDPCSTKPCKNGGTCVVEDFKAKCNCLKPYSGNTCETTPCITDPCKNGGTCSFTKGKEGFSCKCTKEYGGNTCETKCDVACKGDKICTEEAECRCPEGHNEEDNDKCTARKMCEEDKTICGENGVCKDTGPGKYKCECKDTYTGDHCELTYCDSNPCQNGGTCKDEKKGYTCKCTDAYEGKDCKDIKYCKEIPCGTDKGVECKFTESDQTGYCQCKDEKQYFDYANKKCKNVDTCLAVTCAEDKTCKAGKCVCRDGYKTEENGQCTVSFCDKNSCESKSNCTEIEGFPGLVKCRCAKTTDFFNGKTCEDARCYLGQKPDGVVCSCPNGMKWNKDAGDCEHINVEKEKCNDDCGLGWCKIVKDNNTCVCGNRFKNSNDGKCILDATKICAGFPLEDSNDKCNCTGMYELADDGITCERKTMCADPEIRDLCSKAKGRCVDDRKNPNGYDCKCEEGFVKINGICSEACAQNSAKSKCMETDQVCSINEKKATTCRCLMTFRFNDATKKCDLVAEHSYLLENLRVQKTKYTRQEFVDLIHLNADVISAMKQLYSNLEHAYLIKAVVSAEELVCQVELQFKSNPAFGLERVKQQIRSDINCSECDAEIIVLPPSLVLSSSPKDVSVTKMEFCSDVVKNQLCGKEATCDKEKNKCTCPAGYRESDHGFRQNRAAIIQRCEDINECEEGAPCPESSECQNTSPNYFCKCKEGFRKENTTVFQKQPEDTRKCVDLCDLKPCVHGTCSRKGDAFDCSCKLGYDGTLCNKEDVPYKKAVKNTAVVGAVLGTILGVVLIIFFVTVRRLRKNSHSEDFTPSSHQMELNGEMIERRQVRGISNKGYQ